LISVGGDAAKISCACVLGVRAWRRHRDFPVSRSRFPVARLPATVTGTVPAGYTGSPSDFPVTRPEIWRFSGFWQRRGAGVSTGARGATAGHLQALLRVAEGMRVTAVLTASRYGDL
jgi:hypothetical protein